MKCGGLIIIQTLILFSISLDLTYADCGNPPSISNGYRKYSAKHTGSVTTYHCNLGYSGSGDSTIACQIWGTWEKLSYSCHIKNCGTPSSVSNAGKSYHSTTYGSRVTYSCHTGYTASGTNYVVCPNSGKWPTPMFKCTIKDCGTPISIANAGKSYHSTTYGSRVIYSCHTGYTASGHNYIDCQSNGTWSKPSYKCTMKDCGHPPLVLHATSKFPATTYNSRAIYKCNTGFSASGLNTITCPSSGSWPIPSYKCVIKDCGRPPSVTHASKSHTNTTFGSSVTYNCYPGYNGHGTNHIKCPSSGSWPTPNFTCKIKDCGLPSQVLDAAVLYSNTTYGSIAKYTCNIGYIPSGLDSTTCQSSGSWSSIAYTCTIKDCGIPPNVSHAKLIVNSTTYGSYAKYVCDIGYKATGVEFMFCDANGHWKLSTFSCVKTDLKCHHGWVRFQDSCYSVGRYSESWILAQAHCHALGAKLAEIETPEEDSFLRSYLPNRNKDDTDTGHQHYWLGASDMQEEGYWEWVQDGKNLTYTNFQPGQPDNAGNKDHCLMMSGLDDFKWEDSNCLERAYFICEMGLQESSFTNLNGQLFGK